MYDFLDPFPFSGHGELCGSGWQGKVQRSSLDNPKIQVNYLISQIGSKA